MNNHFMLLFALLRGKQQLYSFGESFSHQLDEPLFLRMEAPKVFPITT